jgi:hypothetical protein
LAELRTCLNCGRVADADEETCPQCGRPLEPAGPPPAFAGSVHRALERGARDGVAPPPEGAPPPPPPGAAEETAGEPGSLPFAWADPDETPTWRSLGKRLVDTGRALRDSIRRALERGRRDGLLPARRATDERRATGARPAGGAPPAPRPAGCAGAIALLVAAATALVAAALLAG